MRRLLMLALAAFLLATATAVAQIPADQDPDALPEDVVGVPTPAPVPPGTPDAAEEEDEGADDDPDGDGVEDEPEEDEDGEPPAKDLCETPDGVYAPDADYVYCVPSADNAGGGAGGGRDGEGSDDEGAATPASHAAPVSAPRVVDLQRLPLTGSEPLAILLFGGGMLLAGAGLRVLLRTV